MSNYEHIDEERAICSKCGQTTDEALILSCDHNLCLVCSAKNLNLSKGVSRYQTILCEICGRDTALEEDTVNELLKYRNVGTLTKFV